MIRFLVSALLVNEMCLKEEEVKKLAEAFSALDAKLMACEQLYKQEHDNARICCKYYHASQPTDNANGDNAKKKRKNNSGSVARE